MHSTWQFTKKRINLLPFYMTDSSFTELQSHNICEKKNMKNDMPNIPSHFHISNPNLL